MSSLLFFLVPAAVVILLALPIIPVYRGIVGHARARHAVIFHLCAFFGVMLLCLLLPVADLVAYAAEGEESVAAIISTGAGMGYLAAALATGMSAIGSGIAVASAAPAAIGATSEDPKSFGKALIFVVLGEGIAIYGLLISILIINSLG